LAGLTGAAGGVQGGIFLLETADSPLAQPGVAAHVILRKLLVPQNVEAQEQDAERDDADCQEEEFHFC
jgi:hypothetical protein